MTGYDFPELVENNGEALLTELHIEKSSFRKKLVRHINARMLGVGDIPEVPSNLKAHIDNGVCSTIHLTWTKSVARGFPVHSYRVQRRAIGVTENGKAGVAVVSNDVPVSSSINDKETDAVEASSQNESEGENAASKNLVVTVKDLELTNSFSAIFGTYTNWITVYSGADNDFVDAGVDSDYSYVYRVQAWSSVGRSGWSTIDTFKLLKKSGCFDVCKTKQRVKDADVKDAGWNSSSWSSVTSTAHIANLALLLVRAFFTLTALATAIMRFRRASARSTTSFDLRPAFPWLWRAINGVSTRVFGVEVVPSSMLQNPTAWKEEQVEGHNKSVGANKLKGYKKSSTSSLVEDHNTASTPFSRRVQFQKSISASNLLSFDNNMDSREAKMTKAPSSAPNRNLLYKRAKSFQSTVTDSKQMFNATSDKGINGNRPMLRKHGREEANEASDIMMQQRRSSEGDSESSLSGKETDDSFVDDPTRCNTCRKKYRIGKRWKHHCCRCLSTFCHKHGKVTHPVLTSCKVPGSCICQPCLDAELKTLKQQVNRASQGRAVEAET